MIVVVPVPSDTVDDIIPHIAAWLEGIANRHPFEFSMESFEEDAKAGNIQLWVAWDDEALKFIGCAGTRLLEGKDGSKTVNVEFCTGSGRLQWQDQIHLMEEWGRSQGATRIRPFARPGWSKMLRSKGYRATHIIFEKAL